MIKLKSLLNEVSNRFILDPLKHGNVIIFHGTRNPSSIWKRGIIGSNAGVINKSGFKAVYAAESSEMASSKTDYEEKLKQQYGKLNVKGDRWIVVFSVPEKEVDIITTSSDLRVYRDISPEEIVSIFPDKQRGYGKNAKFKSNTPYIKSEYKDFVVNNLIDNSQTR